MVAVGLVPAGVDFGAADGQPVKVFFLVVSPSRIAGRAPPGPGRALALDQVRPARGRLLALRDPTRSTISCSSEAD